jgi:hypothetical protein
MAGGIISNWKLTLDPAGTPLVLVNYGDKLVDEISLGAERLATLTPLVRSAAPHMEDEQNVSATITFDRYDDSDTDANVRKALLQSLLTSLTLDKKPLKIEVQGITDRYWTFAEALVSSYRPGRYVGSGKPRRLTGYQILAIGLSETGV